MPKVSQSSLGGLVTQGEEGDYFIDGYSVDDLLEDMVGMSAHMDLVVYFEPVKLDPTPTPESPPVDPNIVRRLLDG